MVEGPAGGPRPFAKDNRKIVFIEASTTGMKGEDARIEDKVRTAVKEAIPRGEKPPRIDLKIEKRKIGNMTTTQATVYLDKDFISFDTFDAVRDVVESELDTLSGQVQ